MPNIVKLLVDDSGYNAKIKNAANVFMGFVSQIGGAKGQFGALTKAIQSSTLAQEALNAVMAKNPMGAAISVATVAAQKLLGELTKVSDEQLKIAEAAEQRAEREQHENATVVESVSRVITEYELLRQKWSTLSNEHAKAEWIKENQKKFKQLGMAVKDVKTAEDVFVNNTQAVCQALMARAKAEAYGELYKEQLKKKIANEINPSVENGRQYVRQNRFSRDIGAEVGAGVTGEDINWKTEQVMKNGAVSTNTVFGSYKQSGLNKLNAYKRNQALAIQQEENAILQRLAQGMAVNQSEYEGIFGGLGIWDSGKGGSGGGGRSGSGGGTGESIEDKIRKQFEKSMLKANAFANTISPQESGPSELWKLMTQGAEESTNSISDLTKAFERLNQTQNVVTSGMVKDAKQTGSSWQNAASAIGAVGSALSALEDPGAKIAGIIGQAVAQIALGFAQATTAAAGGGPFAWIAAIAGGLGTMVSTIAAIHSATGFSEGGVVKGSTFSGDQIPAMLNAGEVVLTRAQAGVIASNLQNAGGLNNLKLQAIVSGTQLRFVLNNESQQRGRGQYVTTNFR